jgi:hypothetical protein
VLCSFGGGICDGINKPDMYVFNHVERIGVQYNEQHSGKQSLKVYETERYREFSEDNVRFNE